MRDKYSYIEDKLHPNVVLDFCLDYSIEEPQRLGCRILPRFVMKRLCWQLEVLSIKVTCEEWCNLKTGKLHMCNIRIVSDRLYAISSSERRPGTVLDKS